jgi:hypothetical protein
MTTNRPFARKPFVSSIPLWMRTGQPRQTGMDYSARWYDVAGPGEQVGARALVYLRRRHGVRTGPFRKHIDEFARTLVDTGKLRELPAITQGRRWPP